MDENLATIECLPKGAFCITTVSGEKITGAFSLAVLDQFCENKGIQSYFDAIDKILTGMTIGEYAELLCMAITSKTFKKPEMIKFLDEEFDGITPDVLKLIIHAAGRLGKVKKKEGDPAAADNEGTKKNE